MKDSDDKAFNQFLREGSAQPPAAPADEFAQIMQRTREKRRLAPWKAALSVAALVGIIFMARNDSNQNSTMHAVALETILLQNASVEDFGDGGDEVDFFLIAESLAMDDA